MENFSDWWEQNKHSVCFDVVHNLGLSLENPEHELRLKHLAFQGWQAGSFAVVSNSCTKD